MLTGTSVSPSDALAAFIPLRDACLAPPTTGKDPAWEAARQDFDARLEPYEERLRSQLRSLLGELYVPALAAGPADGRMLPEEVIREVSGLRHVLSRPGVLGALQGEVADLMSGLGNVLVGVQEEAHRRDKDAASHPIEALSALSQVTYRQGTKQPCSSRPLKPARAAHSAWPIGSKCAIPSTWPICGCTLHRCRASKHGFSIAYFAPLTH